MISLQELKAAFEYNQNTGNFIWTKPTSRNMQPGMVAGCYSKQHKRYVVRFKNKLYLRSRLAWFYVYGEWPNGILDHKDMDSTNDRITNLRIVDRSTNNHNSVVAKGHSSTGLRGVRKNHKGFQAVLTLNKVTHYLGTYPTPQQAHEVYLKEKSFRLNNV